MIEVVRIIFVNANLHVILIHRDQIFKVADKVAVRLVKFFLLFRLANIHFHRLANILCFF